MTGIEGKRFGHLLMSMAAGWLFSSLCVAGEVRIALRFQPDPDNGRQVFDVCARCHLPEAWGSKDGTYPQLAGQHVNVLVQQLLDIRAGRRRSPLMWPFVQARTLGGYQNLVDVVAYISKLPMDPAHGKGPWPEATREYARGKRLYESRCASCHGKAGEGDDARRIPRLQGQHYAYMRRQALDAKRGLRSVDPGMLAALENMDEEAIVLALNYVSRIPVPEEDLAPRANWRNPDFEEVAR